MQRLLTPETIKEIRASLSMTQEELAAHVNVERNTVARWEMGLHYPVGRRATLLLHELRRIRRANKRVERGRPIQAAQEDTE
jgi:DNA-binding transcriptional regulator YiaG